MSEKEKPADGAGDEPADVPAGGEAGEASAAGKGQPGGVPKRQQVPDFQMELWRQQARIKQKKCIEKCQNHPERYCDRGEGHPPGHLCDDCKHLN